MTYINMYVFLLNGNCLHNGNTYILMAKLLGHRQFNSKPYEVFRREKNECVVYRIFKKMKRYSVFLSHTQIW